jgi:glutaminyl-peptide cyclotransferase
MPLPRIVPAAAFTLLLIAGCTREAGSRGSSLRTPDGTEHPQPLPSSSVTIPDFDGKRAFGDLKAQTAFGPRNPGSRGHRDCLAFLTTALRGAGAAVRLQEFTHTGYNGEIFRLTNVIASFQPKAPSRVLLCAHWDTRPRADRDENISRREQPLLGANDGASGVAVLLELARLFRSSPPPVGVDIVLFDGEDYGKEADHARYLLGSRHFAATKDAGYVPRFGVLLDMVGDKFLDLPKEQFSVRYAPDIVDLVWKTAARLGIHQFEDEPGEEIMDDHLPLNEAGIKTIDIIDFNYPDQTNRFWHTHRDVPENCSAESLEAVGTVLAHVVYGQIP